MDLMVKCFLNIIFFLQLLNICKAQDIVFNSRFYSQRDGLSSYNASCIAQDKYGFMWIGTQDGLNFFDGIHFKVFTKNSKDPIGGNDVKDIVYDKQNNLLWIAFSYGGVSAIDCKTHKPLIILNENNSIPLSKTLNLKSLWLTTENDLLILGGNSCHIYNPNSKQFVNVFSIDSLFTAGKSIAGVFDDKENYYLLLNEEGIACISKKTKKLFKVIKGITDKPADSFQKFSKVIVKKSDSIYFACDKGIVLMLPGQQCFLRYRTQGLADAFTIDKTNTAWYSKGSNLKKQSNETASSIFFEPKSILPETQFYLSIFFDDKGILWLCGSEGLLISPMSFPVFRKHYSDPEKNVKLSHVWDILPVDSLLYLNDLKGLFVTNIKTSQTRPVDTSGYPYYIFRMPDGTILFNNEKGFSIVTSNKISHELVFKSYPELSKINHRLLSCHLILNDSMIILGGEDYKGIITWDTRHHIIKEVIPDLKNGWNDNAVNSMCKADDGTILICQDKNIAVFDPTTNRIINHSLAINSDTVRFYFDIINAGNYYIIGTYGQGILLTNKKLSVQKQINNTNGLSNNSVYRLLLDAKGYLWASTNFGLNRIDLVNSSVSKYFEKDGLSSDAFEEMSSARQNNELFFGGLNGYTVIHPENFTRNRLKPVIYFTSYNLKTARSDSTITNIEQSKITISQHVLQSTFHFSSSNYITPEKTNYFYRIRELQKTWINIETQNSIGIMGLPPGTYHLEVQAFNEDGIGSDIKQLTLVFLPKWYQTWLFKLFVVAILLTCIYLLYRMRINQFKKEKKIRSKLASDLHDDLGSTMNSVKVYANLAMMEKQADKYLPLIKDGTQEAITGIRDIIWVLDDRKDTIEDLLSRINTFASPICDANAARYKQEVSDNARDHKLGQEERRNLYMMMKEAINNAIKYSGCKNITVNISVTKGKPSIEIKDDGKGFDTTKTSEGNGLKNMHRRAKEIKYKVAINSFEGNGSSILFQKI